MTRVIAIANQKGGVGKTTTTVNLGAGLAERGRSVLVLDLDPQASLTLALGPQVAGAGQDVAPQPTAVVTVHEVLMRAARGEAEPFANAIRTTHSGLSLVPASLELSAAEMDLGREPLGVFALRDGLDALPAGYDYVLLDCPPSLGILTANALAAASGVVIPLQADYLALRGVDLLLGTIAKMQKRANPELKVLALVLTLAMVFGQSRYPLLFLVPPALIFVAFEQSRFLSTQIARMQSRCCNPWPKVRRTRV